MFFNFDISSNGIFCLTGYLFRIIYVFMSRIYRVVFFRKSIFYFFIVIKFMIFFKEVVLFF